MGINLVTGYDINKDEIGETKNTVSQCFIPIYRHNTLNNKLLFDENETTFLYNLKNKQND